MYFRFSFCPSISTIVPVGLQVRLIDSEAEVMLACHIAEEILAMLASFPTTVEQDADTLSQLGRHEDGAVAGILGGEISASWENSGGEHGPARQFLECRNPASGIYGRGQRHWYDLQHARLALEYRICRKQLLECVYNDLQAQSAFLNASATNEM